VLKEGRFVLVQNEEMQRWAGKIARKSQHGWLFRCVGCFARKMWQKQCIVWCIHFGACEILKHIGYTNSMSVEMHIDVNQHLGTSPLYHSLRRSRKHGSVTAWVPPLRHTGIIFHFQMSSFAYIFDFFLIFKNWFIMSTLSIFPLFCLSLHYLN
jgi:hypothetical protein